MVGLLVWSVVLVPLVPSYELPVDTQFAGRLMHTVVRARASESSEGLRVEEVERKRSCEMLGPCLGEWRRREPGPNADQSCRRESGGEHNRSGMGG